MDLSPPILVFLGRFVEVTLTLGNLSGDKTMKRLFRKLGLCINK